MKAFYIIACIACGVVLAIFGKTPPTLRVLSILGWLAAASLILKTQ